MDGGREGEDLVQSPLSLMQSGGRQLPTVDRDVSKDPPKAKPWTRCEVGPAVTLWLWASCLCMAICLHQMKQKKDAALWSDAWLLFVVVKYASVHVVTTSVPLTYVKRHGCDLSRYSFSHWRLL